MRYNICMNKPLKIIKVGNSAGMILPKEILVKLRVSPGDSVEFAEAEDNSINLRRFDEDAEFVAQMEVAREVMERRKRALRELAK
jgi:putative addiction module antidote